MERVVRAIGTNLAKRGANLVEFAILAPLLVMLLFGIIEFAWIFAQNLYVRHGAREGARLAAVNFPAGVNNGGARTAANRPALVNETCGRMDLATGATVEVDSPAPSWTGRGHSGKCGGYPHRIDGLGDSVVTDSEFDRGKTHRTTRPVEEHRRHAQPCP